MTAMFMPNPNHWAVSSDMPHALPSSVNPAAMLYFPSEATDITLSMVMPMPMTPAAMSRGLPVIAPAAMLAADAMAPTIIPMT